MGRRSFASFCCFSSISMPRASRSKRAMRARMAGMSMASSPAGMPLVYMRTDCHDKRLVEAYVGGMSQRGLSNELAQFLTPPEIAKVLRVSYEKVLGWIRRGELEAVDVGNKLRPRYRIARSAFD